MQPLTYIRGLIQIWASLFDMSDPRYGFFYLALTQILKYFLLTIKYRSFIFYFIFLKKTEPPLLNELQPKSRWGLNAFFGTKSSLHSVFVKTHIV